jgi:hypothetical protein
MLIATRKYNSSVYAQEGVAATSLSWIAISLFGAFPSFGAAKYQTTLMRCLKSFQVLRQPAHQFWMM